MLSRCLLWIVAVLGCLLASPAQAVEVPRGSFVIHEMGWAPVIVLDMTMPFPILGERGECRVVIRLDEKKATSLDFLECAEKFRANTQRGTSAWVMELGRLEYYGQEGAFRVTFVFDDKEVYLRMNEAWLKSPVDERPAAVQTSSLVLDRTSVPKYPRKLREGGDAAVCLVTVQVGRSGRPESVAPTGCPEEFAREAAKAAKRWRWRPPRSNGEKVTAETVIRMRFKSR
jgi:TonB family protein